MSDEETIKLKVSLGVSYSINSYRDEVVDTGITVADWNDMSPEDQEKAGQETYDEWMSSYLDGGWTVAE